MYTVKDIAYILKELVIKTQNLNDEIINDFEYQYRFVTHMNTAFISISKGTWKKWLGKEPKILSGNEQLKQNNHRSSLVITDELINDLNPSTPQIIVDDSIEAMQVLGTYFRAQFHNPIIAVTGSMGKSSTKRMISKALSNYQILQNRGNANTRVPILLNLCKLIKNPNFAVFEMSINAINNKGNLSLIVKPHYTIVTGIGEAHLSTIKNTEEVAKFKSRIFAGQSDNDTAIINGDTKHVNLLENEARKCVNHIITYSRYDHNKVKITDNKGSTTISIHVNTEDVEFTIPTVSDGMVSNAIATVHLLQLLDVDLKSCLNHLSQFKPFKKVLEIKKVITPRLKTTLLDDTHNASLPAMLNAIEAFNKQSQFYTGNKIIVLGKISDLGDESEKIHLQLVGKLEQSNADYILCIDSEMRKVVNRVKNKSITWYSDPELLLYDLLYLVNEDGLTLLKSSVTGTKLPKIATKLFEYLQNENIQIKEKQYFHYFPIEKTYAYLSQDGKIENNVDLNTPIAIEGITPLIYYIYSQKKKLVNRKIYLKKWPTNNETYFTGKEIELTDLIKAMINKAHPSLIYQLGYELFANEMERRNYISIFVEEHRLSLSSSVNVTGRFRLKERQTFTIDDLVKIYIMYNDILFENTNAVIFGDKYYHGMIKGVRKNLLIFAMYESTETLISELL
ncbi:MULTISPECIES: Mur ligase family protein [Staphylococcus intermedius group]|uniref:UDP-N-acetylmuramoylalanyl-D-glutamyl-2,6-diaminopimelate--D-alanyl-D-alanyl ligase n=1 Tax=Staphylococcus intermedius NCTC 11048 TaxID=1141106 RepID=A0A380FY26_STAIN|nr:MULTISPECIES: Mur ligase family protein [Staphylococcus intermedius group]PCF82849.1 hypothetical protein B4W69_11935 [Staphylococcus delphini]PNZ48550.1 hypothetical protein CD138_13505 [Staphylococcus intermedius NCTC 11048]SUM43764.1 UDP-N-acetylmuramoylalanyl-D-glutamyl-2,6-diaminopimelate--D-alanyl-D-alanyl ligase [Staphylococcus intermedius NCTC 11048]